MDKALTIAGSDSGGGAGLQADLKTFMAHGVYGTSVITAITAQNTMGIQALALVDPALVGAQLRSVLEDIKPEAVKTGMLGTAAIIEAVAAQLQDDHSHPLVVDPVMVSTSGTRLLTEEAVATLKTLLLPHALIVTPNLPEASVLVGRSIENEQDMEAAIQDIYEMGSKYVLLKGGHLAGDPVDMLYDGQHLLKWRVPRINTPHTHGTGCTYSAAITALLARGMSVEQAVTEAKSYVHGALQQAVAIGAGKSPLHHFYNVGIDNALAQRRVE